MTTTLQEFRQIFAGYRPVPDAHDEAWDGTALRPQYQQLIDQLDQMGLFEFSRRWKQARRTFRDNGIAYSGYSGDAARPRFWKLDALPVLIESSEWAKVQAAIAQRAKLLNLLLCDLYGSQKLIKDGTLPASLIYSDPNFFRSCIKLTHGKQTSNDYLHLYAADIARAPNGEWWILADRTEAPSGLGYALEHRIVMSRMLPQFFRQSNTRRLAPFFVTLQNRLQSLAPRNRDNPRVVLLSDGPTNPYHLEDAYLSRYLGYLLVEDGDLAVRSRQVMLKTLGGLQPVDVVLRHQNASECDPLEHNTTGGVAGLTQAIRGDNVAVANQLGSGIVESDAYMAFSPRLCKRLLNEELLLPNVATWWCGEPESLKFVLEHLDRLTIQPAFRNRGRDEALRTELQALSKDEMAERLRSNPNAYVAKESVARSSVPVWRQKLHAERLAIRTYAVSDADANEFHTMDGGLGRVTKSTGSLEISIRKGENSKDIWILSDEPVPPTTLLSPPGTSTIKRRSGAELPSRVADNLFWLGRRLERTEFHARLIGFTAKRLIGELSYDELPDMPMLLRCLASEGLIEPGYAMTEMRQMLPNISLQLGGFVLSNQPDSFSSGVHNLVRLGYLVRDRLSVQAFRIIQKLEAVFNARTRRRTSLADLGEVSDELQTLLAAFSGIVIESMTRTQVFQFLDLGRRLERSHQILNLLNNSIVQSNKIARVELEAILELLESRMTYRSRYMANVHEIGVLDLVVTDETNPRSLAYQIMRAKQHIDQLPREKNSPSLTPEQKAVMSLLNEVRMLDVECEPLKRNPDDTTESTGGIAERLSRWGEEIETIADSLSHRYLVHAKTQQLTEIADQ